MKNNIIKTAYRRSGLSYRDIEDLTGVHRSTIGDWINYPDKMKLSGLIEIANAIGLTEAEWQQLRKGV